MRFLPAFILTLSLALGASARAEVTTLQWGNQRAAAKKQDSKSTSLRFVKPGVATTSSAAKATPAPIKLVAYEAESAPLLTSGRETEAGARSVVVSHSDEPSDGFRAAQLPGSASSATGIAPQSPPSNLEDTLRSPFSDSPQEPTAPAEATPMPTTDAAGQTLPAPSEPAAAQPDNRQLERQPSQAGGLPQDQQPAEGQAVPGLPQGVQPDTGQFQPVLPAGPGVDQLPPTPITPSDEAKLKAEGERAQESCEQSLKNLRAYTVDKVNLNIAITGTEGEDFPFECLIDDGTMHAGRCWEQITYMWKASAMCHKPLYFEDEQLERYGHSFTPCLQPFVSGAHFFTRPFVLPYCMGVEPPCECIYALGHYRPGNCAPYMCNPIPLSPRGALLEAGVVTGVSAALP